MYYFVDETEVGGGRLTLKRVNIDGRDRQTIMVIDRPLRDTKFRPSKMYPLSTISSDGKRLAISAFLGDGQSQNPPWGLMVFNLEKVEVNLIVYSSTWGNMHPQYCRAIDLDRMHDILIQEDHGNLYGLDGTFISRHAASLDTIPNLRDSAVANGISAENNYSGLGPDVHVIRDDGSHFRTTPWGRDGNEVCQGHQCWRGRSTWAIASTTADNPYGWPLIESMPLASDKHIGLTTPNGVRNVLSRKLPNPRFYHFATDIEGERLISDADPFDEGGYIFVGELGKPGKDPLKNVTYILNARTSGEKETQIHPFLSPCGSMAFFNSDESGILQAYMIQGL